MISCVFYGAVQRYPVVLSWLVLVKATPLELEQRSGMLSYVFSIVIIGSHYFQTWTSWEDSHIWHWNIVYKPPLCQKNRSCELGSVCSTINKKIRRPDIYPQVASLLVTPIVQLESGGIVDIRDTGFWRVKFDILKQSFWTIVWRPLYSRSISILY